MVVNFRDIPAALGRELRVEGSRCIPDTDVAVINSAVVPTHQVCTTGDPACSLSTGRVGKCPHSHTERQNECNKHQSHFMFVHVSLIQFQKLHLHLPLR